MPFTQHLSDPTSLLGQWVKENLGNTRQLVSTTNKTLRGLDTISPPAGISPATAGTAIDLRIRYHLGGSPVASLEAVRGAGLCTSLSLHQDELVSVDSRPDLRPIMEDGLVVRFFNDLRDFVAETMPRHRLLDDPQEERLNRFCIVLAMLDGLYKGAVFGHLQPGTFKPFEQARSTQDILSTANSAMVKDVTLLSRAFAQTFQVHSTDSVVVGPGFTGSDVVNGCEADLIADGTLIDLKTTAQPKIAGPWLRQLLCYYLMDLGDSYAIERLGIYLTRQRKLVDWDVAALIKTLTGNPKTEPRELRTGFRAAALRERKRLAGDSDALDGDPKLAS